MTQIQFQQIADTIPVEPGIYKYYNSNNELLYVGKAKNLRKRISSYFSKTFTSYKTHELVQRIHKIEFTIVNSEQDAFLLENSLIKEFQPKYNINLKDDKTYPYIIIKKEPFPRIFLTRKKINDGSEYLGPFTSAGKVRELISFIRQYIPLRTCKLNLIETNIKHKKFKVCLEYHLGNCLGPCEGLQTAASYNENILQVKDMLKGNLSSVMQHYTKEMKNLSLSLEFEKAAVIKKKLEHLKNYESKSVIVSKHVTNVDVFSIIKSKAIAFVNYLMVQNGTIIQTHTIQLETKLEETENEILSFAIENLREKFNSLSLEIIVPIAIELSNKNLQITIPKAGDKKKLLDLSIKNAEYFTQEIEHKKKLHVQNKTDLEKKQVLYELKDLLHLAEMPTHIECFDNSNFQGSYPVSAMVCFIDGLPNKKQYRHYNVKTVNSINDFASMKEVVFRRYKRILEEQSSLPQLVIIDGGKGQLNAAMESIEALGLTGKITLVGLAKNIEELFFVGDNDSLKLPWDSDSLKLIRYIRNEVHRFGITFHRNKRSKGTFINELEKIEGIGKQTTEILMKQFKSVKKISVQSETDLVSIIGASKAKLVFNYFKNKKGPG